MKRRERFNIAVALTSIMQAGLSVLVPPAFFMFIAKILTTKFGFPQKIMIFAIVFGIFCGFYNMVKFIYIQIKRNE